MRSHLDIQRQVLADTSRQPAEAISFLGDLKVKGAPGKPVPADKIIRRLRRFWFGAD
jgi:hypothetical protein